MRSSRYFLLITIRLLRIVSLCCIERSFHFEPAQVVFALKEADAGRLKMQAWIIARCIAGLAIAVPAQALEINRN